MCVCVCVCVRVGVQLLRSGRAPVHVASRARGRKGSTRKFKLEFLSTLPVCIAVIFQRLC